jgi:hypothetical protein
MIPAAGRRKVTSLRDEWHWRPFSEPPSLSERRPYLSAMHAALANNDRATVLELPKLNHMFQTAQMGSSTEFGQIEETLAPAAMKRIGDWIDDKVKQ